MQTPNAVAVATNGIRRMGDQHSPDIRFVIHYDLPGQPSEQYYQESRPGGGATGRPATACCSTTLLLSPDRMTQEFFHLTKNRPEGPPTAADDALDPRTLKERRGRAKLDLMVRLLTPAPRRLAGERRSLKYFGDRNPTRPNRCQFLPTVWPAANACRKAKSPKELTLLVRQTAQRRRPHMNGKSSALNAVAEEVMAGVTSETLVSAGNLNEASPSSAC